MSQCPICNAATWIGQRYCSTCDSYLPNPEEEDHFCPQCSIRVGPQQELCHKCNARLAEMAGASLQTMTRAWRLPPWVRGIFSRHRFGHRGSDYSIALHQKSPTASAGGGAALSTRCRADWSRISRPPKAETAPSAGVSSGCTTTPQTLIDEILATPANFYNNVHTTDYPAGAIRGALG